MTTSEDEVQQTKLLYTIATHPAADWRAAFIRRHEQAEGRESELLAQLAVAQARNTELEAATDPLAAVTAAATALATLTGDACYVQCCAWHHLIAGPEVKWTAYRVGQSAAEYSGATCEEATAKVRADWAEVNAQSLYSAELEAKA